MDVKEAMELREKWDGSKCEHLQLEKEFMNGMSTGDKVCTKCGKAFYPGDDNSELEKKK